MRLDPLSLAAAAGLLAAGVVACGSDDAPPPSPIVTTTTGAGGSDVPAPPPASPNANVKFKSGKRLRLEYGRILDLPAEEVCRELGTYGCLGIHRVVLGEPDAFGIGLYEKLENTTATTPLAVERFALAGCTQRAQLDFDTPDGAVLFSGLALAGDRLAEPTGAAVRDTVDRLYQRALGRRAKEHEIERHLQFYADVESSGDSQQPARDWATLSCFSVLTSMEMLFY